MGCKSEYETCYIEFQCIRLPSVHAFGHWNMIQSVRELTYPEHKSQYTQARCCIFTDQCDKSFQGKFTQ